MKTTLTKLSFTLMAVMALNTAVAQPDLVPGINYSYDPPAADGIIHNIEVDYCNNESSSTFSFDVSMYLYDQSSGDHWVIGTITSSGVSGFACNTYSGWDIDINDTPGIPAGTYRLGLWVDSDDDVSETDEDNNAGLLSGNINYNPSAVGIKTNTAAMMVLNDANPNPASGNTNISFQTSVPGKVVLEIFDITGKKVSTVLNEELTSGKHEYQVNLNSLQSGIYFYSLSINGAKTTKKLVVQ